MNFLRKFEHNLLHMLKYIELHEQLIYHEPCMQAMQDINLKRR